MEEKCFLRRMISPSGQAILMDLSTRRRFVFLSPWVLIWHRFHLICHQALPRKTGRCNAITSRKINRWILWWRLCQHDKENRLLLHPNGIRYEARHRAVEPGNSKSGGVVRTYGDFPSPYPFYYLCTKHQTDTGTS